jgi:hypothetical protein
VDSDSPGVGLGKVALARAQELVDDVLGRDGAIHKEHVFVLNALVCEAAMVVLRIVETDDLAHLEVLKDVDVAGGRVAVAVDLVSLVNWTHEGQELAWDDPVEVTVLYLLVMLVLLDVKSPEVVPSVLQGLLQTLEAVHDCEFIVAFAFAGVTVVKQMALVVLEQAE